MQIAAASHKVAPHKRQAAPNAPAKASDGNQVYVCGCCEQGCVCELVLATFVYCRALLNLHLPIQAASDTIAKSIEINYICNGAAVNPGQGKRWGRWQVGNQAVGILHFVDFRRNCFFFGKPVTFPINCILAVVIGFLLLLPT